LAGSASAPGLLERSHNMKIHSKKLRKVQNHFGLPCEPRRPSTRAGLHLTQRYGVNPAIADLLASFAGFEAETAETIGAESNGCAK
jgi:hypothetical protein